MTHVATHCGGVGEPGGGEVSTNEPTEFVVTIHNHSRLNYAIALKRWPNESERHWDKRQRKLKHLQHQIYELADMGDDEWYYHEPSYIHEEPS